MVGMGVLRQAVARGVLHFVAMLVSAVSGIVLARRLDSSSYALYQMIARRVVQLSALPSIAAGFWAYRYSAMGVQGVARAYMVTVLLSGGIASIVAMALAIYAGAESWCIIAMAAVSGFLWTVFARYNAYAVALRPVFSELVTAIRRVVYAAMIFILVYLAAMGLYGAFTAFIASSTLGTILLLRGTRKWLNEAMCRRCLGEWLRGAYVPTISWVATMLAATDAAIVTALGGSYAVAAFFASTAALSMLVEILTVSLQHLTAYVLRTQDVETGLRVSRVAAFASAMVCGYAMARPESVIAIMNPIYVPASRALQIYALGILVTTITTPLTQVIAGTDRSRAGKPGKTVTRLALAGLISSAIYIATLSLTLLFLSKLSPVELWTSSFLVWRLTQLALVLRVADTPTRRNFLKYTATRAALYIAIAYTLSITLTVPGYEPRFIDNVLLLLRNIAPAAAIYTAIVLAIDPELKGIAKRATKMLLEHRYRIPI